MQSKCEINESPIEYLELPDRDGAEHKEEPRASEYSDQREDEEDQRLRRRLPHSRRQLLHGGLALLGLLLRAAQDVAQLLQMVQRAHQLPLHRLHLALQHLRVMEGVPPNAPAGAHLLLQVLHCRGAELSHVKQSALQ